MLFDIEEVFRNSSLNSIEKEEKTRVGTGEVTRRLGYCYRQSHKPRLMSNNAEML